MMFVISNFDKAHVLIIEEILMKRVIIITLFFLANEHINANELVQGDIEVGMATTYYNNGIYSDNQLYPYISYSNDNFYFEGTSIGLNLIEGEVGDYFTYETYAFVSYELNSYEVESELALKGIESIDDSIDIGFQLDVTSPFGGISFSAQHDISNTYDGYQATLSFGFSFEGERWSFTPFLSFDYLGKEYVDYYYFGNQGSLQFSPENLIYKAESTVNKSIGYLVGFELTDRWSIGHSLEYGVNGSTIKNSPLADGDNFTEAGFVITYVF